MNQFNYRTLPTLPSERSSIDDPCPCS